MAINFPSSPNVNDTHTHNGKEWTWNGTSWVQSTNASSYTLPIATAGALGGIRVGNRLTIDSSTGVLDADVQGGSYGDGDVDTHLNQSNPTSGHVLSWNGSDYAWVAQTTDTNTQLTTEQVQDIVGAMVDGGTETRIGVTYDDTAGKLNFVADDQSSTPYTNSDVDTHLNQSNPTSGYVLAWNGSDYTWVAQTGGGSGGSGGSILQLIQETGPSNQISATAGQGSNAAWIDVIDKDITITAGANKRVKIEVNGEPKLNGFRTMRYEIRLIRTTSSVETTLYEGYQGLADSSDNYSTMNGVLYLDTPGAGTHNYKYQFRQVISWNNSAAYVEPDSMVMLLTEMDLSASGGSSYANSDVDTHLNQFGPATGTVLSWNGSDYAWVAQSAGTTLFTGLTDTPSSLTADKWLKVNSGGTALEYTDAPTSFTVSVGDAAPSTPSAGDLWFKSDELALKVNYNDGTSSQWVDASPPAMAGGGGGGGVAQGTIVIWSGTTADIPNGWSLCDGTNGTPNLTDKFVVGAGNLYNPAGTGGSADAVVVQHSHTTSIDGGHVIPGVGGSTYSYGGAGTYASTIFSMQDEGVSGTDANLPPYYALCYIMCVSASGSGGGGGASVTVSDTAPSSASAGDMWWHSDEGRLKIYYEDATPDSQWVDASPGSTLDLTAFTGNILPATHDQQDIGNPTHKIRDLYLGSNSLHLGSIDISESSGSVVLPAIEMTGHMIPDTNAAYDLGNAEYKIRHLFLSDNSIKFIDDNDVEHALSVSNNKLHYEGKEVLANCVFTGLDNNHTIKYNGSNWVNAPAEAPAAPAFQSNWRIPL